MFGETVRRLVSLMRKFGVAASLLSLAISLLAANSPAPASPSITNFIDPEIVEDNPQVKQLMESMRKEGQGTGSLLDEHFLFASLLWGSIGMGYLLYARRQRTIVPFIAGVAMVGASYFASSWIWMSIICLGLMVAVYQLARCGY